MAIDPVCKMQVDEKKAAATRMERQTRASIRNLPSQKIQRAQTMESTGQYRAKTADAQ